LGARVFEVPAFAKISIAKMPYRRAGSGTAKEKDGWPVSDTN